MTVSPTTSLGRKQRKSELDLITAVLVPRQSRGDDGSQSVEDQIEAMRDYCARQTPPWQVGSIYEERDVSGRRPLDKRKGLKRAVEDIEAGHAQVLLTAYFDRFVRSVATRAEVVQRVEKASAIVMTMDMGRTSNATAADKLSGTLLAAIAEFYADQIGEKMKPSIQRNIDKGIPPFPKFTLAYRQRADKTLEPDPVNAPLIREACERRARGESYVKITRWLHSQGLEVSRSQVITTLGSKLLIGEIHFGDFEPNLSAIDEPLIDRATWRAMHQATASRGRQAKSERLLARLGVLVCETCGARMTVSMSRAGKGGQLYPYYRCGNRGLCPKPASIPSQLVEDFVRDEAIAIAADTEGRASFGDQLEEARLAAEEAEAKLGRAIQTLLGLEGESASRDVLTELTAERDARVAEHERLAHLAGPAMTVSAADWDALSFDEKRGIISSTIRRALVAPGRGAGRISVEPFGEESTSSSV